MFSHYDLRALSDIYLSLSSVHVDRIALRTKTTGKKKTQLILNCKL